MTTQPSPITIASPQLGPEVEALVLQVVRSGRLAQGPMVERFEELCCTMSGARHAIAMSNGTVTLEAILEVLDLHSGDEVITTPFTFAATINAAIRSGATIRFADILPDFTIDPDAVEALVNERTRVLLPVHLYGLMADMERLEQSATQHRLSIVEDAAQAHGASIDGRRAGGIGIGSFSFYATKNVAAGEGGVVTTSDDAIAERLRLLRNQGMSEQYRYEIVGRNLRLTELQAAVAIPQLEHLGEINERRGANARLLTERLASVDGVITPKVPPGREHVWHQYTILLSDAHDRDRVIAAMKQRGVMPGVYYPALAWDHRAYVEHPQIVRDETPRARSAAGRCLSLPVHHGLERADIERVAAATIEAIDASRR